MKTIKCNYCEHLTRWSKVVDGISRKYLFCRLLNMPLEYIDEEGKPILRPTWKTGQIIDTPFDCPKRQARRMQGIEPHYQLRINGSY